MLEKGFLYVRGFGGSLFWSTTGSTRFFSKGNLEPINLGQLSTTPTGGQAVLEAWRCPDCELVAFPTAGRHS
jgi:hypothetical protein